MYIMGKNEEEQDATPPRRPRRGHGALLIFLLTLGLIGCMNLRIIMSTSGMLMLPNLYVDIMSPTSFEYNNNHNETSPDFVRSPEAPFELVGSRGESQLADSCRRRANEYIIEHADQWFKDDQPTFAFVLEAPPHGPTYKTTNQTNLYFILTTYGTQRMLMGKYAKKVAWACGDHVGRVLGTGCKWKKSLIIVCPLDYSISHLTATPKRRNDRSIKKAVYNVSYHMSCLRQESLSPRTLVSKHVVAPHDTAAFSSAMRSETISVAQCLIVHGWRARRLLKRNIVYHGLLGVDHAFVYVHDNSSNLEDLPLAHDTVTLIPSDMMSPFLFNNSGAATGFHWQPAQLLECITRCRAAGYDFVLLADVDEFVQIIDYPRTTLQDVLLEHQDKPGIMLRTINFPPMNPSVWKPDWFDFVWRE